MSIDTIVKVVAGIAAIAIAASAVMPLLRGRIHSPAPGKDAGVLVLSAPTPPKNSDAHLVLDVAERLRAAGNIEGAKLAHQLIDAILETPCQPKV